MRYIRGKLPSSSIQKEISIEHKTENELCDNKSLASKFISIEPKYNFCDVILPEKIKNEIRGILNYYKYHDKLMVDWGLNRVLPDRKGIFVNLYGPSGVGKTICAHAMAAELNKMILPVNYAEIESKYVGETSKNLYELFSYSKSADVVLLFDEADALLSRRVTNMTNSTDTSVNQTKSVLLNIMNDYSGMVVFTTNYIENYDFAFMRRIPFQIKFELPDKLQREAIWKYYLECGLPHNVDYEEISDKYSNISGGDIANAVFNAALNAVDKESDTIQAQIFYEAIERIIQAKNDNKKISNEGEVISKREVSEEYALEQIRLSKEEGGMK